MGSSPPTDALQIAIIVLVVVVLLVLLVVGFLASTDSGCGFVIGIASDPYEVVRASRPELDRHLYMLGATGSGKTTLLVRLIDSEIDSEAMSVVAFDRLGDLNGRLLQRASGRSIDAERVVVFDPGDDHIITPWNPLAGAGDAAVRAQSLLVAIRNRSDSWGPRLEQALRACLQALAETGKTLLHVSPLLNNDQYRRQTLAQVNDFYTLQFFETFDQLSPESRLTWSLPVLNKLAPFLASQRLTRVLCGAGALDLTAIINDPKAILLVSLRADRLQESGDLLGELLLNAIWQSVLTRSAIPEHRRVPISLFCDEFQNFGNKVFQSIIAEGRRYRLHLRLAHQSAGQLDPQLGGLIQNNAAVRVLFAPGAVDAQTFARELVPKSRTDSYEALMRLQTGAAYVMRRGRPAANVMVPNSPDPGVEQSVLDAFTRDGMRRYGRPVADIDRELAEEMHRLSFANAPSIKPDVRHQRRPRTPFTDDD